MLKLHQQQKKLKYVLMKFYILKQTLSDVSQIDGY